MREIRYNTIPKKTGKSSRFEIKALSGKSKSEIFLMSNSLLYNSYKSRNLVNDN